MLEMSLPLPLPPFTRLQQKRCTGRPFVSTRGSSPITPSTLNPTRRDSWKRKEQSEVKVGWSNPQQLSSRVSFLHSIIMGSLCRGHGATFLLKLASFACFFLVLVFHGHVHVSSRACCYGAGGIMGYCL